MYNAVFSISLKILLLCLFAGSLIVRDAFDNRCWCCYYYRSSLSLYLSSVFFLFLSFYLFTLMDRKRECAAFRWFICICASFFCFFSFFFFFASNAHHSTADRIPCNKKNHGWFARNQAQIYHFAFMNHLPTIYFYCRGVYLPFVIFLCILTIIIKQQFKHSYTYIHIYNLLRIICLAVSVCVYSSKLSILFTFDHFMCYQKIDSISESTAPKDLLAFL